MVKWEGGEGRMYVGKVTKKFLGTWWREVCRGRGGGGEEWENCGTIYQRTLDKFSKIKFSKSSKHDSSLNPFSINTKLESYKLKEKPKARIHYHSDWTWNHNRVFKFCARQYWRFHVLVKITLIWKLHHAFHNFEVFVSVLVLIHFDLRRHGEFIRRQKDFLIS